MQVNPKSYMMLSVIRNIDHTRTPLEQLRFLLNGEPVNHGTSPATLEVISLYSS